MQQGKKIVLIGEKNVGKTTLVKRLMFNEFHASYVPTLGVEVYPWNDYTIWDCAGVDELVGLRDCYWLNADIAIIMVDCTSEFTAKAIKKWYRDAKRIVPDIKIGILTNKMDCFNVSNKAISYAKEFARNKNIPYEEISCKDNFDIGSFIQFIQFVENVV